MTDTKETMYDPISGERVPVETYTLADDGDGGLRLTPLSKPSDDSGRLLRHPIAGWDAS